MIFEGVRNSLFSGWVGDPGKSRWNRHNPLTGGVSIAILPNAEHLNDGNTDRGLIRMGLGECDRQNTMIHLGRNIFRLDERCISKGT